MMMDKPIIVFDTDCVLCSGMVAFVLTHELGENICFVGAWSNEG
jgi:predicted DCC family thiol-disulfide oxidoreductase YuxK